MWCSMTFFILSYLSHMKKVCCSPTTCDCWFYFIFCLSKIFKWTNSNNKKYLPGLSSLAVLWVLMSRGDVTQKHHNGSNGNGLCCSFQPFFFGNWPFWQLQLHQWVLHPKQHCRLVCLLPGVGGGYLAWCTSHGTNRLWKIKKLISS